MNYLDIVTKELLPGLLTHGIKILAILLIAYVIHRLIVLFIEKLIRKITIPDALVSKEAEKKREGTLIRIFSTTTTILIWLIALLMVLDEAGFAIAPLLATAGIAGLALGFGGQYLIRDLITGLFIILENQYRIGDVIRIENASGLVEDITLRMTTLRDIDGVVHHIPHGEIRKVSNLSKNFSRVNLDIGISYNSNLDHVISVVNAVGEGLANDPIWKDQIFKPALFQRVENFSDSAIIIKILGETKPMRQWDVAGELRKRLIDAFEKEKIELPFPQRVIHHAKP